VSSLSFQSAFTEPRRADYSSLVAQCLPTAEPPNPRNLAQWWAHLVGAIRVHRVNIEPTFLRKKIEELRILRVICLV